MTGPLAFLTISVASFAGIVTELAGVREEHFWKMFIADWLFLLVFVLLMSATAYVIWKTLGGKVVFETYFALYGYSTGIILFATGVILFVAMGMLELINFFKPVLYKDILDAFSGDASFPSLSNVVLASTPVVLGIFLTIPLWLFAARVRVAFRRMNGLSRLRSFWAWLFFGLAGLPIMAISLALFWGLARFSVRFGI